MSDFASWTSRHPLDAYEYGDTGFDSSGDLLGELSTPSELARLDAPLLCSSRTLPDFKLSPLLYNESELDEPAPETKEPVTSVQVASRCIGGLTPEQRRTKIAKYLQKKARCQRLYYY